MNLTRRAEAAEQERSDVIRMAAEAARRSERGEEIVDIRGVGQPFKFSGKRDSKGAPDQDFAEWSLKMMTFLKA
eukprot:8247809-Prorocentrum_lima.AAC.1